MNNTQDLIVRMKILRDMLEDLNDGSRTSDLGVMMGDCAAMIDLWIEEQEAAEDAA